MNTTNPIIYLLAFLLVFLSTSLQAAEAEYVTYLSVDPQGSPLLATDEQGAVAWQEDYEPWGGRQIKDTASASSSRGSKVWYTGKEEEASLGLYYHGARWYMPEIGQFTAIDPIGVNLENPRSFGRYVYANNNPIINIDPDGRDAIAVVFPNYKIATPIGRLPGLGHAGVLLIDNKTGETKYYEYGRYRADDGGMVRNVPVSNVKMASDGRPTADSLAKTLEQVSQKIGSWWVD